MAKRKWLLSACGAVVAGGLISSAADAGLTIDLRLTAAPAGVTFTSKSANLGGAVPAGDFLIDVYAQVTDSGAVPDANTVSVWGVVGSFLTTGTASERVLGNIAPNGATNFLFTDETTPLTPVTIVGITSTTPSYSMAGGGSAPGAQVDLDSDTDVDLGSTGATATGYVAIRSPGANPDPLTPVIGGVANATGTPITNGKEWLIGKIKFTATAVTGANTNDTNLNFAYRSTASNSAAWWFEGGSVSGTNLNGLRTNLDSLAAMSVGAPIVFTAAVTPAFSDWDNGAATGLWNGTDDNWVGVIPNAAGADARFQGLVPAAGTVTVVGTQTVGKITLNNTNPYTLTGGAITLDNSGSPAEINVTAGSHSVVSPITSTGNINVTIAPAAGTLTLGKVTTTGTLSIPDKNVILKQDGTAAGTLKLGGLSLGATAQLDVKDNDIVTTGSVATYKALLVSGYNAGAWDGPGIITSLAAAPALGGKTAAIGYAQGNDANLSVDLAGNLSGAAFTATDVLLKYTYQGDADMDGDVDPDDVGLWASNFTGSLTPGTGPSVWTTGDWDYDGDTDPDDVGLWASNFTGSLTIGGPGTLSVDVPSPIDPAAAEVLAGMGISVNVVPEPASLSLLGLGALGLLRRRSRK